MSAFEELAILLGACALVACVFVRLRQPMLIAYLVVGVVGGPAVLGIVQTNDAIDLLAQVGVAVLLFLVGLKLDLHHVRHLGPVALATGLGQLAFTIAIGFVLLLALQRDWVEALYVAVALTFSSTIIIVKLLSDKRELDSLHGRIAVGFLIVQDFAVVLAMIAMSGLREAADATAASVALQLALRLGLAAAVMFLLMRYVLPGLVQAMVRSQELLLVFALAWGTGLAALGEWAGFSKEAGAFLAGFSLASTGYRDALNARLTGVRDFLLLFFFVDLGAKLEVSALGAEIVPALLLSAFVLIGNPLIVMAIMGWMGYRARTGFLAGLTVAQISEFSIVFVAMGIALGHVGEQALVLTTLVGMVTITVSTYMILHSHALFERFRPWLGLFERASPRRELALDRSLPRDFQPEVIVFGLGRYGTRLIEQLAVRGVEVLGVDFDPEPVRMLRQRGLKVRFGDAESAELVESLPLASARWAVSTLPQSASTDRLLHGLTVAGFRGKVATVVREESQRRALAGRRIDCMLDPFRDGADRGAALIAGNASERPRDRAAGQGAPLANG